MHSDHTPVMLKEVVESLSLEEGLVVVDATFGFAGHAREVLKKIGKTGKLIGFERDKQIFEKSRVALEGGNCILVNDNFINLKKNLEKIGISQIDRIYFDLGVSTYHYHQSGKGFSFSKDEELDMRLDGDFGVSAADLINGLSERELADLFYSLAQEYRSRQIAKAIVESRRKEKITSSAKLAEIISLTIPRRGKIHPATKVFQALRIAVNDEFENIEKGVENAVSLLKKNGIILVISFHSLEDRIVKNLFKNMANDGVLELITKKPIASSREENLINPSSRSAKIRVARRI